MLALGGETLGRFEISAGNSGVTAAVIEGSNFECNE
jgi:hypothetical protein